MTEGKKEKGFMNAIKEGLIYISEIISESIFPSISKGAQMVMNDIDDRIMQIEKRIIRKISSLLIIGFGGVLLIFSLLSFLKEYLGWSNAAAFFAIGITIFVIGLILKLGETN